MFVVSLVLAAAAVAYGIVMFSKHGPIPVLHFFILSREQKQEALCPKEYRNAGIWLLVLAATWILNCLIIHFLPGWTLKSSIIIGMITACYLLVYDLRPQDSHYQTPDPKDSPIPKDAIC